MAAQVKTCNAVFRSNTRLIIAPVGPLHIAAWPYRRWPYTRHLRHGSDRSWHCFYDGAWHRAATPHDTQHSTLPASRRIAPLGLLSVSGAVACL